jgi:hypothetical protein
MKIKSAGFNSKVITEIRLFWFYIRSKIGKHGWLKNDLPDRNRLVSHGQVLCSILKHSGRFRTLFYHDFFPPISTKRRISTTLSAKIGPAPR